MLPVSTEPEQVPVHDDMRGIVVGEHDLDWDMQDGALVNARIVDAIVQLLRRVIIFVPVESPLMCLRITDVSRDFA